MTSEHHAYTFLARITFAVTLLLFSNAVSAALELSIIESGPEPGAEIGLWARDLSNGFLGVNRLVSPSGEVFTPDSVLENDLFRGLLLRFNSVSDAMEYVEGTWQATPAPLFPFPTSPVDEPFDFSIAAIPLETINRTAPSLLTPSPGAVIKNGTTFNFGWDYLTSGEAPNRTSIVMIPQFDPISSWSRSVVSTPQPGRTTRSSGSTGTGERRFSDALTNVPGADKNRFLLTLEAADAALPLDVQITLGSYYSSDSIFPSPRVRFYYSRENDPFFVTLSTVPEPSSVGLVIVLAVAGSFIGARAAARPTSLCDSRATP
jgi:hypothetical protein